MRIYHILLYNRTHSEQYAKRAEIQKFFMTDYFMIETVGDN